MHARDEDFGLGNDPAFRAACAVITRAAASDLPLLLGGESGTGKERAARAAHARSPRRDGPFVALHCGALPEALLEAELFGHARGAFTGATAARGGLVEEAARGTLFLDEIGDASPAFQLRLLRVVAAGVFRRVGESRERRADVRLIAATHHDLEGAVREGRFRADLWYRLAAIEVILPPLRARGRDVVLLANAFLAMRRAGARFDPAAIVALRRYAWPGNVRELEWAVARTAVLAPEGDRVGLDDLPARVVAGDRQPGGTADGAGPWSGLAGEVAALESRRIAQALVATHGSRAAAARLLGMSRQGLWKKLRRARFGP